MCRTQNFLSDSWVGIVQTYAPNYWTNIDFSAQPWLSSWALGYPKSSGNCGVARIGLPML